jgi:uncharacterized membrane protein YpjA
MEFCICCPFMVFWHFDEDGYNVSFYFYLQIFFFFLQEDYRLLETMNRVTITKYSDMKQIAGNVARTMIDLNEKCK